MTIITPELRTLIESDALGHLVTINDDGSPQVSVVWIGLENDEIVIGHLGRGHKMANIERDPRVARTIEAKNVNETDLRHYAIIHGEARIEVGGAPQLLQRLAAAYIGPGVKFPPTERPASGHAIGIAPTRISGVGPWA